MRKVRCRGANMKFRALRLDQGNFAWGSENTTRKVRVTDVVYNASDNELVLLVLEFFLCSGRTPPSPEY